MTTYTPNYQLPLYEGSDKPDLADQYADAMQLLDAALTAAQAARTELQNSVATLNTNLAATNANVDTALSNSALAKTDAANAVNLSQAATNTANAASAAVAAMQTDVTNNKTLVEEHVNYFADLEITDEQSAQNVNTKINSAFQGSMSNTQAITAVNQMLTQANNKITQLEQERTNDNTFNVVNLPKPTIFADNPMSLTYAVNASKTILKVYGYIYNQSTSDISINKIAIPGLAGYYGLRIDYDTGLRPAQGRYFRSLGIVFYSGSTTPNVANMTSSVLALGTDGYIYLFPGTATSSTWKQKEWDVYLQIPLWLAPADWPIESESKPQEQ